MILGGFEPEQANYGDKNAFLRINNGALAITLKLKTHSHIKVSANISDTIYF